MANIARYDSAQYDIAIYDAPNGEVEATAVATAAITATRIRPLREIVLPQLAMAIRLRTTLVLEYATAAIVRPVSAAADLTASGDMTVIDFFIDQRDLDCAADAIVETLVTDDCLADAVLLGTQDCDLTADAWLDEPLILEATAVIEDILTADLDAHAIISATMQLSLSALGIVQDMATVQCHATATIQVFDFAQELTADAFVSLPFQIGAAQCTAMAVVLGEIDARLIADAELFDALVDYSVERHCLVAADAVVVPGAYTVTATGYIIDLQDVFVGGPQMVVADAAIRSVFSADLVDSGERREVSALALLVAGDVVTQARTVNAQAVLVAATPVVRLPNVRAAIVFTTQSAYYDGRFYTNSSNSPVTNITVEAVQVSLPGITLTLVCDAWVVDSGATLVADAVILAADRMQEVTASAQVIGQQVLVLPVRAAIARASDTPVQLTADARIEGERLFPLPAQERLI